MKNDPALAQRVMEKVERLIVNDVSMLPPDRIYSYVVVLDEDGEIAHACGRVAEVIYPAQQRKKCSSLRQSRRQRGKGVRSIHV